MQQYGYDLDEIRENEQGEAEIVYKDRSGTKKTNEGVSVISFEVHL